MASPTPPARPARRVTFGRREKLVVIGALGLIAIGAIHFLVFKERVDALGAAQSEYESTLVRLQQLQGQNYQRNVINEYRQRTQTFQNELLRIIARENLANFAGTPEQEQARFRERERRLRLKWQNHNRNRRPEETNLTFIGEQTDLSQIARGQYLWNLPEKLPEEATQSVIRDNLTQAQGKYRLIQRLENDPVSQRDRQLQFNEFFRQLGINTLMLGADHVTIPEQQWAPYRLAVNGVELEGSNTFVPADQWSSVRLPQPLDTLSALAHIDLLLDAMYPPPFDAQTMERARANPNSLSSDQRTQYETWARDRDTMRAGDSQTLGLEKMLDVHYSDYTYFYNLSLDEVEKLVDLAIQDQISSVIMIKVLDLQNIHAMPDPWEIPKEPEVPQGGQALGRSGPQAPRPAPAEFTPEMAGANLEELYGPEAAGYFAGAQRNAAPAPPPEPPIAGMAPIFMRVSGDYARVMTYIIDLSTGPYMYSIEEMTIFSHPQLPTGHVAADLWIMVPLSVNDLQPGTITDAQRLATSGGGG
jgi:hypothetical protein